MAGGTSAPARRPRRASAAPKAANSLGMSSGRARYSATTATTHSTAQAARNGSSIQNGDQDDAPGAAGDGVNAVDNDGSRHAKGPTPMGRGAGGHWDERAECRTRRRQEAATAYTDRCPLDADGSTGAPACGGAFGHRALLFRIRAHLPRSSHESGPLEGGRGGDQVFVTAGAGSDPAPWRPSRAQTRLALHRRRTRRTRCRRRADLEDLWRDVLGQFVPEGIPGLRDVFVPVAYCRLPVKATPKGMCRTILDVYGDPHPPTLDDLVRSVRDAIRDHGTTALLISDITRLRMHREGCR